MTLTAMEKALSWLTANYYFHESAKKSKENILSLNAFGETY
jgi:hypothetical protein